MVMALVLLPAGSTSSGLPILLTVGLAITLSGHAAGVYSLDYFARPIEQKLAQRVFTRALRPSLHRLGSSSLYMTTAPPAGRAPRPGPAVRDRARHALRQDPQGVVVVAREILRDPWQRDGLEPKILPSL